MRTWLVPMSLILLTTAVFFETMTIKYQEERIDIVNRRIDTQNQLIDSMQRNIDAENRLALHLADAIRNQEARSRAR